MQSSSSCAERQYSFTSLSTTSPHVARRADRMMPRPASATTIRSSAYRTASRSPHRAACNAAATRQNRSRCHRRLCITSNARFFTPHSRNARASRLSRSVLHHAPHSSRRSARSGRMHFSRSCSMSATCCCSSTNARVTPAATALRFRSSASSSTLRHLGSTPASSIWNARASLSLGSSPSYHASAARCAASTVNLHSQRHSRMGALLLGFSLGMQRATARTSFFATRRRYSSPCGVLTHLPLTT